jgi:hypothetical protein
LIKARETLAPPKSTNFDFHAANFLLNFAVLRLFPKFFQIGVFGEPFEIVVTEIQAFFERKRGAIKLIRKRIAAREIVKY